MGKGVTQEEVMKMMNSVVSVTVHLYPTSYKTDMELYKTLSPVIMEHDFIPVNDMLTFELSYNSVLRCIDEMHGVKKYLKEFSDNFDINQGIEANYAALTDRYSSLEIILLYGVFKNLSYINMNIHLTNDNRPAREHYVTSLRLPDLKIDTLAIKLRDFGSQRVVDMVNKYLIEKVSFDDNVMSKHNLFMADNVGDFLSLIEQICQANEFDQEFVDMMKAISFLDIEELKHSIMLIITDWPVL